MSEVQVDTIVARIRGFLIEKFPLAKKRNLQNNDSLIDSGIVDSLGILDLVTFLESEFGLQVSDEDLLPENFQSVECIAALVRTKTS